VGCKKNCVISRPCKRNPAGVPRGKRRPKRDWITVLEKTGEEPPRAKKKSTRGSGGSKKGEKKNASKKKKKREEASNCSGKKRERQKSAKAKKKDVTETKRQGEKDRKKNGSAKKKGKKKASRLEKLGGPGMTDQKDQGGRKERNDGLPPPKTKDVKKNGEKGRVE